MLKGQTHKITYFERHGREQQKGKPKKIKRTKIIANWLGSERKDLFFRCGAWCWDRCHQVHVRMCTIDAIAMESYAPGLFLLSRTSQNAIEKLYLHALSYVYAKSSSLKKYTHL